MDFLKDVEKWKLSQNDPQTLVEPQDSISNVSRKSKRSAGSSAVSSTASARLKVATERAVLLAREKTLEKKHALDMESAQLKIKMEQMELEMKLAESEAKLKALENFENEQQSTAQVPQAQQGDV